MKSSTIVQSQPPAGVNQILEIFKMQYLMKFMDASGTSGRQSIFTIFLLLGYDQFVKYIPYVFQIMTQWFSIFYSSKEPSSQEPLLLQSVQPPASKTIKAFIQFERAAEGKVSDLRIDAVLHHVCNLPEVRSLRYNGVEMIPNFKDALLIENDIWFELVSQQIPATSTTGNSGPKQESIVYRLSTYDHDILWLHRFVEQAMETFEQEKRNKLGSEQYYFDMIGNNSGQYKYIITQGSTCFTKSKFVSNRSLQNVYLKQIDDLQTRVDFFLKRRDWYDVKGIPHTLGIVMYGVPGCGKTSTIKAIANETKRHIFNLLLSEIKTKEALKDLFYNDQVNVVIDEKIQVLNIPLKQRLYVIEDIDAMNSIVIKRSSEQIAKEQEHKLKVEAEVELLKQTQGEMMTRNMMKGKDDPNADKLDLATLLNVLDGVRETPGRIIILSTNYPERLDEALLRPGRFDMMLEFEKHSCAVLKQHLEKHYDVILTKKQESILIDSSLEKKWTPAEVSQILFRRIADLDGAIQDLYNEDPAKLFRFSQQKQEKQEQSTDLSELLKDDVKKFIFQKPTSEKSTVYDDDYDTYLGTYDGPKTKTPESEPSPEPSSESEPEPKTEPKIPNQEEVFKECAFSEQSILFGTHADMGLLSANDIGFPEVKKAKEYAELELVNYEMTVGGQSEEVQNFKLPQNQLGCIPAEFFGIAAANEVPETTLDDFFPDIS